MCSDRKQSVKIFATILAAMFTVAGTAAAQDGGVGASSGTAGGVTVGEGAGGVTDRAYVTAPPNYAYVIERARGSFLDCGDGQDIRATDDDGRDAPGLRCGVTLTETIVIPTAATSARVIVHF